MRESKINWPRFFRPVCVLCMVLGVLWLFSLGSIPRDNLPGLLAFGIGGVLFLLGGFFGLLGRPRSLVPLLDFFALAAAMVALWQVGIGWKEIAGVALAALYLVCCNATTIIGDEEGQPEPDYSELHLWWENMENYKKQLDEQRSKAPLKDKK